MASHCESSPGSSDKCRLSAGWPPTLRPSQSAWAVSPLKNWQLLSTSSITIVVITQPVSWYSCYVPCRMECWVDLGTAVKVHSPYSVWRRWVPCVCDTVREEMFTDVVWTIRINRLMTWYGTIWDINMCSGADWWPAPSCRWSQKQNSNENN